MVFKIHHMKAVYIRVLGCNSNLAQHNAWVFPFLRTDLTLYQKRLRSSLQHFCSIPMLELGLQPLAFILLCPTFFSIILHLGRGGFHFGGHSKQRELK